MDTIKAEHEINELKLDTLKSEVEKAVSPEPAPAVPAAGHPGPQAVSIPIADGSSVGSNSTSIPSSAPPKPSRSPVDIASQLFSRNKSKSSKTKNKKGSNSKGRTPPNGTLSPQSSTSTNNAVNVEKLKSEIEKTQESEMKLVSSAIGINPDGQALTEEGSDEVLDLADQLLAQLDAKDAASPSMSSAPAASDVAGIASGSATATETLAAPQPINAADAHLNAQTLNSNATYGTAPVEGGHSLAPASSRQSVNSSSSAVSTASTTVPPASSSRSRHSSSSSAPKSTGFGAKLKQALSPNSHRDEPSSATTPIDGDSAQGSTSTGGAALGSPSASTSPFSPQTYKNRHALRKEKKKAKEDQMRAEAQAEIEAERANGGTSNKYDAADVERQGIESICRSWNLELVEMEPDGHCMYSAIADQLTSKKISTDKEKKNNKKDKEKWDYSNVRKVAAEYMRNHMDDFLPYLPAEDVEGQGEGLLTKEGYMKHCDNVESTSEWGSQTELLALSKALELPIWVIQSRSPVVKLGTEEPYAKKKSPLIVTYHRVQYGLGEHYNSARVLPRESGMVYLG